MKIPFVDLKAQYESIKEEIDKAIAGVINNTSFIGGGIVSEFEIAFAEYIGLKHCVACANGTDSMEIILKAMGVGPGDEVLVPANSWISTAEVVNNVGAEPVFVDVLEDEYTIDPSLILAAITNRTKAIIPVHLYGMPARMEDILNIARQYKLKVIEDCAQAHGASINGKKVGTFGHAASFSFYPGKNLGAYGDAGGIVTNNDELARHCRMIGNHGQLSKHDHQIIGRNSRMDTMQAAILKAKLPYLDQWVQARNQVAQWYDQYLDEDIVKPVKVDGYYHAYHLYVIRSPRRDDLITVLGKEGIGCAIHYPTPLPLVKAYEYQGNSKEQFIISDKLAAEIVSIPMFPEMMEEEVRLVSEIVKRFHS
ncbi:MAG: erythromycin biosynthesis sensory transduction protein eryC1 [Flammeovirgaceae bacterium]|nr:erythromycin biosynthesis sensory transduction protein eryC1 [Flammeovirgaceae bacterium]